MADALQRCAWERLVSESLFYAIVTHKGRQIAELIGSDPVELEARAHRYAIEQGYRRAVVSVRPA